MTKLSKRKGLLRLSASILVALGFAVGGASQMIGENAYGLAVTV